MKRLMILLAAAMMVPVTPALAKVDTCLKLEAVTPAMMPPELYNALAVCIDQMNLENAATVYAQSILFVAFDNERVRGLEGARRADAIMVDAMVPVAQEKLAKFRDFYAQRLREVAWVKRVCAYNLKNGPPSYDVPSYMLLDPSKPEAEMEKIISKKWIWDSIVQRKLNCPA